MTKQRAELAAALAAFNDAAYRLNRAWEAFDFSDPSDAERESFATCYPFPLSFDVVAQGIAAWAEAVNPHA